MGRTGRPIRIRCGTVGSGDDRAANRFVPGDRGPSRAATSKKADMVEHPEVFDHAGLLVNEPPGIAGLPFI